MAAELGEKVGGGMSRARGDEPSTKDHPDVAAVPADLDGAL